MKKRILKEQEQRVRAFLGEETNKASGKNQRIQEMINKEKRIRILGAETRNRRTLQANGNQVRKMTATKNCPSYPSMLGLYYRKVAR